MGNHQPRYLTSDQTRAILGGDTFTRVHKRLERHCGRSIDFEGFEKIVRCRFERMPKILCECLFRAFAADIFHKVDIGDFVAGLAVLGGYDRALLLRFLFRIYDVRSCQVIERARIEKMMQMAYGERWKFDGTLIRRQLDILFSRSRNGDCISFKEFEMYTGSLNILGGWVQAVLNVMISQPSPRLSALEKRYSVACEQEEVMSRYGLSEHAFHYLRKLFHGKCAISPSLKAEMTCQLWIEWVQPYICPAVANAIFFSRAALFQSVWRFPDFVEFCMVYGASSLEVKMDSLCSAFYREYIEIINLTPTTNSKQVGIQCGSSDNCTTSQHTSELPDGPPLSSMLMASCGVPYTFKEHMRRMVVQLSKSPLDFDANKVHELQNELIQMMVPTSEIVHKSTYASNEDHLMSRACTLSNLDTCPKDSLKPLTALHSSADGLHEGLHAFVESRLADIEVSNPKSSLPSYVDLLIECHSMLPGIKGLSMAACCIFGVRPPEPLQEKEFIMELLVRRYATAPHSSAHPYGPPNSEWCVISKAWYDSWQFYVGHARVKPPHRGDEEDSTHIESNDYVSNDSMSSGRGRRNEEPLHGPASQHSSSSPDRIASLDRSRFQRSEAGEEVNGGDLKEQESEERRIAAVQSEALQVAHTDRVSALQEHTPSTPGLLKGYRQRLLSRNSSTRRKIKLMRYYMESPPEPTAIDNWSILKKTGARQLLHGSMVGQHLEVLPPAAYTALHSWYGGGPKILRKVIAGESGSGSADLELFPLCLKICSCDDKGIARSVDRELLFSRNCTVAEVVQQLCEGRQISPSSARLWNYGFSRPTDQHVVAPELTLSKAQLQDGQTVLLEICTAEGIWPRSRLQLSLGSDQPSPQLGLGLQIRTLRRGVLGGMASALAGSDASSTSDRALDRNVDDTTEDPPNSPFKDSGHHSTPTVTPQSKTGLSVAKIGSSRAQECNDGLVGLENLGNTCYLNSSLQALLHTPPLMEYFLKQKHLADVNATNKDGFAGKLAYAFANLAMELWTSQKRSFVPKRFFAALTSLKQQFRGNDQHDAQELLAFLLDGLSEDLNLVQNKPYTQHPDSDGRPDKELADIWWENHQCRDFSVIQALFTGQFKSVMSCRCGYSSARYEPFNFLTLPVPEESQRTVSVHVMSVAVPWAVQCSVRLDRDATLRRVADVFVLYGLEGINDKSEFIVAEVVDSKITLLCSMNRRLSTIRDVDTIFFFQIKPELLRVSAAVGISGQTGNDAQLSAASTTETINPRVTGDSDVSKQRPSPSDSNPLQPTYESILSRNSSADSEFRSDIAASVRDREGTNEPSPISSSSNPISNSPNSSPKRPSSLEASGGSPLAVQAPVIRLSSNVLRLACVQRRAKLNNNSGLEFFRMDPFGLPILEIVAEGTTGRELYRLIARRVSSFLKASVAGVRAQADNSGSRGNLPSGDYSKSAASRAATGISGSDADTPSSGEFDGVRVVDNDIAVGGPIPNHGFVLRTIAPGNLSSSSCSRCPWLASCQGCLVPENDKVIDLVDGETLGIDWHFIIFEEILDSTLASEVRKHRSVVALANNSTHSSIPFSKCLDKFTEEEKLEGMICPKCKDDSFLRKRLTLWRLPPVLVVQLKRFQFDRFTRRKLMDKVDFPLDDLNLTPYIAKTKFTTEPRDQPGESMTANPDSMGSHDDQYDLFGVVHHVGVMGEGHYVTTVRTLANQREQDDTDKDGKKALVKCLESQFCDDDDLVTDLARLSLGATRARGTDESVDDGESGSRHTSRSDESAAVESNHSQWHCFNDGQVRPVARSSVAEASSAYVLFYLRKDCQHRSIAELFPEEAKQKYRKKSVELATKPTLEHIKSSQCNKNLSAKATAEQSPGTSIDGSDDGFGESPPHSDSDREGPAPSSSARVKPAHLRDDSDSFSGNAAAVARSTGQRESLLRPSSTPSRAQPSARTPSQQFLPRSLRQPAHTPHDDSHEDGTSVNERSSCLDIHDDV